MILVLLSLLLTPAIGVQSESKPSWRPASFHGLVMGRSRRVDMLRLLGRPKWTRSHNNGEREAKQSFNNYGGIGEFPGNATVVIDARGLVSRVEFYPAKLSRNEAIAHFGTDYVVTRYAFDLCEKDEDAESLYESSNGPITFVEYRGRGIAISLGVNDMVTKISYVSEPIGHLKARCE